MNLIIHVYKSRKLFYKLLGLLVILAACKGADYPIQEDKTFEEVFAFAKQKDQPFCVVLVDSTQALSKEYLQSLRTDYYYITDKAVFNIIDISSKNSEEYVKALTPVSLPLACIFSPNGQLIDLIPGAAKESFLYSEQAIQKQTMTEYHWPNRFGRNKESVVPLLTQLFLFKQSIDENNYEVGKYQQFADSLSHPYATYLSFKATLAQGDSISSTQHAQSLLALETADALELYRDEFIEAKRVLNPNFKIETAPNIKVEKTNISLENCRVNEKRPLDITIYNTGNEPLIIEAINMSCTCVNLEGKNSDIIIDGKQSYLARFYFAPENEGLVSRDIYIASNALNSPNLHINILADVKTE